MKTRDCKVVKPPKKKPQIIRKASIATNAATSTAIGFDKPKDMLYHLQLEMEVVQQFR